MFGASIYLSQDKKDIFDYLDKMSRVGAKTIFTSMHILEDDKDDSINKIKEVSNKINENNLELMVDISTNTLKKYEMTLDEMVDFLKNLKVKSLRIDYGFTFEEIKNISRDFNIVLNASTIDDSYCENLTKAGLDLSNITVCHNFYPRPETGLSEKFLLEKNKYLKSKGFKIQAFIPGDDILRGPLKEGLPTLERHRFIDPLVAYIELKEDFHVDEVLVGDISMKEESLRRILKFENENLIELNVKFFYDLDSDLKNVIMGEHKNRKDYSEYILRSTMTRVNIKKEIEPYNNIERKKGYITLDNKKYLRYNGELQIALRDLKADERVNVIGEVLSDDINLLKYIIDDVKFKFIEMKKAV
ncbi:MupG family TIM beta-alpha barrel fold protein [uncultured Helcococcus sp.]|uniref:MupG family TIM beta-alpha barrel fold protein n=1 Tax=uncultured Helcococcus sp. TaxID=1072508 RepID=UPI00262F2FF6|nr:MupG family TIM beta-alpha barrel fold protein [uncultured Helcococcus sp.]